MPAPLLSRFDLIFLLQDDPSSGSDALISRHLLELRGVASRGQGRKEYGQGAGGSRGRGGASSWRGSDQIDDGLAESFNRNEFDDTSSLKDRIAAIPAESLIPIPLVKTFIRYAKSAVQPELTAEAAAALKQFYIELRKDNRAGKRGSISVTTRQLEALVRLSQARARTELSALVTERHVLDVIEIYLETAVCADNDGMAMNMKTATGKKSTGKSASALMVPFRSALTRLARQYGQSSLSKADVKNCAKQIITLAGSPIDAEALIETGNFNTPRSQRPNHAPLALP